MRSALLLLFLTNVFAALSQSPPRREADLSRLADEIFAAQDQDLNYDDLYENIAQLISQPLDINRASAEELRFLHVLSEQEVQHIIRYRREHGNFISLYELQAVDGLEDHTIQLLLPFVQVPDPMGTMNMTLLRRMLKTTNSYIVARYSRTLEKKAGERNDIGVNQQFQGSADAYYLRFRNSRPADFSVGFTSEKDAGEKLSWKPSRRHYGADYFSFHIQLQNKGRLKNLVIGDFQYQFAQGILLGGSFGFGKGGEIITTVRKSNIGFTPYTSANEAFFLRGAAATYAITRRISVSGFFSRAARDVSSSDDDGTPASILTTGLHRNEVELEKRKQLLELNYGGVIRYVHNKLDAGVLYSGLQFEAAFTPDERPYNQFAFTGTQNRNLGAYVNYTLGNISFFSEAAKTMTAGYAWVAGALVSLTPRLDMAFLHRKYTRDFISRYSSAFAESASPQNETGIYWGWKYKFSRKYSVSGYLDLFDFPWLRYRSYAPASGYEWLMRFQFQPDRKTSFIAQAREEAKPRNIAADTTLYFLANGTRRSYWATFNKTLSLSLKLKSRYQFSTYSFGGRTTRGMAFAQDVTFDVKKFSCTVRAAWFHTDDFDNRQYVYENDVWLAYAMPAYFGKGLRTYAVIGYNLNRHLTFWLRYARTHYHGQKTIGSGVDEIKGNTRNDIKFQVRYRF